MLSLYSYSKVSITTTTSEWSNNDRCAKVKNSDTQLSIEIGHNLFLNSLHSIIDVIPRQVI